MTQGVQTAPAAPAAPAAKSELSLAARFFDSDVWASFKRSKTTMVAAFVTAVFFAAALFAGWISPQDPFDPGQLELMNSRLPPVWEAEGQMPFLLGSDEQGRDILSAILHGLRISLLVGFLGVAFSAALGHHARPSRGLSRRRRRYGDHADRRRAAHLPGDPDRASRGRHREIRCSAAGSIPPTMLSVLVFSIGLSFWVQYARTVRGSVMVEKNKDYIAAARLIGLPAPVIMMRHVLPNVLGPVLVIATINLALAIITEATLSFLGSGMPEPCPRSAPSSASATTTCSPASGGWWPSRAWRWRPWCSPLTFWAIGCATP
jgi:peptide/nickel transport system permease protein